MKTTSLAIENLCVPCHAHCRYCLLSSDGSVTGVDYERGKRLAERLIRELKECREDLRSYYYIGYCMDSEHLMDYIHFSREHAGPSAHFLQMNGIRLRSQSEMIKMIGDLHNAGVDTIDLTFYGTKEYHDKFAGRSGDFAALISVLDIAESCGMKVHVSCPLHKENVGQAEELLILLGNGRELSFFLPHAKGRGCSLNHLRLDLADYQAMSDAVKAHLGVCKTEGQLIEEASQYDPQSRTLTLVLDPKNIETLEQMRAIDIVKKLEALDDRYYDIIPTAQQLAVLYGDQNGMRMYRRFRDLYLEWQQQYIRQYGNELWDMNDETHHFSVRA